MNSSRLRHNILLLLALLVFSKAVPAQTLPSLPMDSRIQKGKLGCGVQYYMVSNPSPKGYAQIAIVQRDKPLSEFSNTVLDPDFLSRMGVAPGEEGYVREVDGSTVYHFRDIPFYRPEVLDSMLLYSFSQVYLSRSQQAVVVSGDIDPVELKKKMDIFSMMVPKMQVQDNHEPAYQWQSNPAPQVVITPPEAPVTTVSVTYAGARVPFQSMNTAQAIVTDLFGAEFKQLLQHRLKRNLKDAGIPYGSIDFRSLRSMDHGGNERYTVSVSVAREKADEAMRVMATTLAQMDCQGVSTQEFADAKKVLTPEVSARAQQLPSQEEDIRRCTANFLYGSNLAPYSETRRYFSRKGVAAETEAGFFNQFSSALLGQLENLTLEFDGVTDTLDTDQALFNYNLAYLWGSVVPANKDYSWHSADTSALEVNCPKVKLKSEKQEAVTGGSLWTFSNGMRVVYKQVPGSGTFHYALQLGGGLAHIPGLKEGEGGYVADMLSLYNVAGIPAPVFRDILSAGGISMQAVPDVNNLSIQGSAPSGQLQLLLKALLSVANSRSLNASEFQYYAACEQLRQPSVTDLQYRQLFPGFACNLGKLPASLSAETQKKAHKFYEDRFSRMQDALLVISGDLKEDAAKRLLLRYLGGFQTEKAGAQARKSLTLKPLAGTHTASLEGEPRGIYVMLDAEYALTSDNYYVAQVAAMALEKTLAQHMIPHGYTARVKVLNFAQPQERFQLQITCLPGTPEGLPALLLSQEAERAVTAVRAALIASAQAAPDPADLRAWKALVKDQTDKQMASPSGFVTSLVARYSSNKDITSRYAESISAISPERVQTFLKTLTSGGRIELISHE